MRLFAISIVLLITHEGYSNDPPGTSESGTEYNTYQWINRSIYPSSNDHRVYFRKGTDFLSPFHDIPLYHDKSKMILNMIVEMPRGTKQKMEISRTEPFNPIKQDVNKYGSQRKLAMNHIVNYGAFPQTWESPKIKDKHTNCFGDNDPIDVIEIGSRVANRGDVLKVKVLGIFALIDQGETDWKVVAIDINDPKANKINTTDDILTHYPDQNLSQVMAWFKVYKVPENKRMNEIGLNDESKDHNFAMEIIDEVNKYWKELLFKQVENSGNLACDNISVEGSPYKSNSSQILNNIPHLKALRDAGTI